MKRIDWYEIEMDMSPLRSFNFVIVANNINKWWLEKFLGLSKVDAWANEKSQIAWPWPINKNHMQCLQV